MVELREEGRLKYSNQPSGTAKVLNWGLVGLLTLLVLGFLGYGSYCLVRREWVAGSFVVAVGLFMAAMLWLIFGIIRVQQKVLLRIELREDGYFTYIKQIKTGEVSEHLVPFSQIQEVLIGRSTRYQPKGEGSIGFYVIGAKIVMKSVDDRGQTHYSVFGLEKPEELCDWVSEFRKHGIPVYATKENVKLLGPESYQTAYEELPKAIYEPDTNPLHIGRRERRDIPVWMSSDMKVRGEGDEKLRDKRLFRPILLGITAINLLLAAIWMPAWPIQDGIFADDSASMAVLLANAVLLVLTGTYWRRRVRWYRSLLDSALIVLVQFVGAGIAALLGNPSVGLFGSILVEGFLLILVSGLVFLVFRAVRLFMKWVFNQFGS